MSDIAEAVLEGTLKGKEACLEENKGRPQYSWTTRAERNHVKK